MNCLKDPKTLIRIRRKVEHATQLAQQKMIYNLIRMDDELYSIDTPTGQPVAGTITITTIKPGTRTVKIKQEVPIVVGQFSDCYPASVGDFTDTLELPQAVASDALEAAWTAGHMAPSPDGEPVNLAILRRVQGIRAKQEEELSKMGAPMLADMLPRVVVPQRPEERVQAILRELFPGKGTPKADDMKTQAGRP